MEKGKMVKGMVSGMLAAAAASVVLILIFAFVLLKLQLDAGKTELLILLTYLLSCLIGGWFCGRKQTRRKFLWGMLTGVLYFLLLFLLSGMSEQPVKPEITGSLLALAICAIGGMTGGMLA